MPSVSDPSHPLPQVCIATEESYFILKFSPEEVAKAQETKEGVSEDGIEDAFDVSGGGAVSGASPGRSRGLIRH